MNALPDGSADPDEIENDTPPGSAPDRNISSALDRKYSAGPIGLNSAGISSQESSSSSNATELARTKRRTQNESTNVECEVAVEAPNELAPPISRWTRERGFQRLRSDRRLGYPDKEQSCDVVADLRAAWHDELGKRLRRLDTAVTAATRTGEWRNWAFLTLQIQLAAERLTIRSSDPIIGAAVPNSLRQGAKIVRQ